jgi:hypothetical protein
MTLLLIIAAASFPMVFGQVVRLVTGTGPDDPEFLERYRKSSVTGRALGPSSAL